MKNKNAWFSPKLYVESLRRLRLVGIVSLILLAIANVLIAINFADYGYSTPPMFSALELNGPILAVIYVAAPLMTLILFSFLNQRNGSDFFASAPVKRECLYFSAMAAVISWCAVLILGATAVSLVCSGLFCNHYTANLLSFWMLIFNTFAGCVFVAGVFAIAVSITGTIFTNIIVALLILVMPPILTVMIAISAQNIPFVLSSSQATLPWYLDGSLNTVTWPIHAILFDGSTEPLMDPISGVYTLCLGIICIALGAVLFHFRKSETAGRSAPNRTMQAVYRLSIALLITLPCCEMIFADSGDGFFCLVLYIIAAAAYFIYELITTKKVKNLLRAAPGLLILIVLNSAVIGGKQLVYLNELNFAPDTNQITSVSITSERNYYDENKTWFSAQVSDLELRDDQLRDIVSRSLKTQVQAWKESGESYGEYYRILTNSLHLNNSQPLVIRSGIQEKGRLLYMSDQDWQAFTDCLEANAAFQSAYQNLPSADDGGVSLSCSCAIDDDTLRRVYDTLREEVASLDFTDWYTFIKSNYAEDDQPICSITITAPFGTESTVTTIDLYPSVLPKTCAKFFEENLSMQPTLVQDIEKLCENFEENDKGFELFYCNPSTYDTIWSYAYEENCDALLKLMQETQGTVVEPGDAYFTVTCYSDYQRNASGYYIRQVCAFFPLKTEEQLELINEVMQ